MKKLFLLSLVVFFFAGCSKDETTDPGRPDSGNAEMEAPHFYGCAMLEAPQPETRGIANKLKVWPRVMAEHDLSVKFLNGTPEYRQFVKDAAAEWEKAAGVRFYWVNDDQEAMIRIGFDYVRGMQTSWSYTGMDLIDLYDLQDEPTIHYASWRRISDEKKRSDVLRSFGQTLGLELEFRHPILDPGWIRNEDGTLDEAEIQRYWEDELAGFITWDELKTMVLDPISVNPRFIAKTDYYDPYSVMNWPFFERIANSQQPIQFDSDYKTELSEQDKLFIASLYGESFNGIPDPNSFLTLIEYDSHELTTGFKVTTNKRLVVIWDEEAKECSYIDLPANSTDEYTTYISHTYKESKTRKVVIGEMLEYGQEMPSSSTALTKFDFMTATGADNIVVKNYNEALATIYIRGGEGFIPQDFNFASNNYLKELYLIQTLGSTVNVDNCQGLEVLSTTPGIYKPIQVHGPKVASITGDMIEGEHIADGPIADWPLIDFEPLYRWPSDPMTLYSLGNAQGDGIDIQNCNALKTISLDNTQVTNIDFRGRNKLEYIYLSSFAGNLVGGGTPQGQLLLDAINKLPSRNRESAGLIVLRGIEFRRILFEEQAADKEIIVNPPIRFKTCYGPIAIDCTMLDAINAAIIEKNWTIVWDSGLTVVN